MMKVCYIITASVILLVGLAFSQNHLMHEDVYYSTNSEKHGTLSNEIITGIMLNGSVIKLTDNAYWIKSGTINSRNGEVLVSFDRELMVKNRKAINQVEANNGYILEIVTANKSYTTFYIWIASENGKRDSDDIIIEIKQE